MVDALCILNDKVQPLFKYISTVLFDLGLSLSDIISFGNSAIGINIFALDFSPFLFNSPLKLKH